MIQITIANCSLRSLALSLALLLPSPAALAHGRWAVSHLVATEGCVATQGHVECGLIGVSVWHCDVLGHMLRRQRSSMVALAINRSPFSFQVKAAAIDTQCNQTMGGTIVERRQGLQEKDLSISSGV